METNNWSLVSINPPPQNLVVLVYSVEDQGYAVALNTPTGIRNAITGQAFGPSMSHWCLLPDPPVAPKSGFASVSQFTSHKTHA